MKLSCMGDSLTNGHGLPHKECWTTIVSQQLGITVKNHGISGDTTTGMVGRFYHMLNQDQPSAVFTMGGTNDISFGLSNEHIVSNIKTMTRQARHHAIPYIIGIPTTYYPTGLMKSYEVPEQEFIERLISLQKVTKQFAIADGCPFIDFSQGLGQEDFLEDGIHPNVSGQLKMARKATEVLRDLIKVN